MWHQCHYRWNCTKRIAAGPGKQKKTWTSDLRDGNLSNLLPENAFKCHRLSNLRKIKARSISLGSRESPGPEFSRLCGSVIYRCLYYKGLGDGWLNYKIAGKDQRGRTLVLCLACKSEKPNLLTYFTRSHLKSRACILGKQFIRGGYGIQGDVPVPRRRAAVQAHEHLAAALPLQLQPPVPHEPLPALNPAALAINEEIEHVMERELDNVDKGGSESDDFDVAQPVDRWSSRCWAFSAQMDSSRLKLLEICNPRSLVESSRNWSKLCLQKPNWSSRTRFLSVAISF